MYSNYSFQFLEISSVFLSYHNGNTNISIARVGGGLPHYYKNTYINRAVIETLEYYYFFNL